MATTPLRRLPTSGSAELQNRDLLTPSRMPRHALCAAGLAVVGVVSVWPTALSLLALWRTDPLKSVGVFVPLISFLLILRVWRALGWEARGSSGGLLLLAATILVVHWREQAVLELVLSPSWTVFLPPHSLVAFLYVSASVLIFGGTALYRAAWFPVAFIVLVNPVPNVFNRWIDLPLQHASALTARAFAHALGQRLSAGELSLMFTPRFGMFIAPGCNGIRGSLTMGLIALVAAYVYRFRLRLGILFVAGAVLLGYAFNLLRLCALVVFYVAALHLPWLQSRAEMGDYVIGAVLFFLAALLLFSAIARWSPARDLRPPPPAVVASPRAAAAAAGSGFWWRCAGLAGLLAAGSFASIARSTGRRFDPPDRAIFPAAMGVYTLRQTWQEKLGDGTTLFDWAAYSMRGAGPVVEVGVSPTLGAHDTLLCHTARGEDWLWHGEVNRPTAAGAVAFSASLYDDGTTEFLEASTVCSGDRCGQWSRSGRRLGIVYSRASAEGMLGRTAARPIPVLLKVEMASSGATRGSARLQLQGELENFLREASLPMLTAPYRLR